MKKLHSIAIASLALVSFSALSSAARSATSQYLPPALSWNGSSQSLIVDSVNQWQTPAERSDFVETPNYQETIQWLNKLANASPLIRYTEFGQSGEGRPLPLIIASTSEDPQTSNKPKILIQAGIHSGEIDGKDAGMMMLRDIAFGSKRSLLKDVDILFIPILSVDGHENASPYNRPNQRGPYNMGWRTNSKNLNLNRDYAKAETKEMQALLALINQWQPALYLDIHVTDGIDYQYDVTYGFNRPKNAHSKNIATWLNTVYRREVDQALKQQGHVPGPLVFAMDNKDLSKGIVQWTATPRFSNGYGDLRHLPTVLVENHSLKPYKQRVLGTYVLIEQSIKTLSRKNRMLTQAIKKDIDARGKNFVVTSEFVTKKPADYTKFLGVDYQSYKSEISGDTEVKWLGKAKTYQLPLFAAKPKKVVSRPKSYVIPAQWQQVIQKLRLHGIKMKVLKEKQEISANYYKIKDFELAKSAFEGRVMVTTKTLSDTFAKKWLPKGSVIIDTEQHLGNLAMGLLEPMAPDSLFSWGYLSEILQRTEYIEGYVIEPMAKTMLENDPELNKSFKEALKDPEFAANPRARLQWFYERSPYYDRNYLIYPIGRIYD
jgi:murein tripeptide amidase MpaA